MVNLLIISFLPPTKEIKEHNEGQIDALTLFSSALTERLIILYKRIDYRPVEIIKYMSANIASCALKVMEQMSSTNSLQISLWAGLPNK